MYILHLAIFVFALSFQHEFLVTGLKCYECRSDSDSNICVSNNVISSDCGKKYCTTFRQEYLDPVGKIQHFYRSCEDAPTYLNAVIKTPNHVAYYRACEIDLCNNEDGIEEFSVELTKSMSKNIYIVPGTGSGGVTVSCLEMLIVSLISLAFL